ASRLLVLPRTEGAPEHRSVRDLPDLLREGDLLVVNDVKVIPARLHGRKEGTGGKVELLLVEPLGGADWLALGNASKPLRAALVASLRERGIELAAITLHVGPGTFLPVRTARVEDHRMHRERYSVPRETAEGWTRARERGGRVVAVGTTALRTLEAAAERGR